MNTLALDAYFIDYILDTLNSPSNFDSPIHLSLVIRKSAELNLSVARLHDDIGTILDAFVASQCGFNLRADNSIVYLFAHRGLGGFKGHFIVHVFHAFNALRYRYGTIHLGLAIHEAAKINFTLACFNLDRKSTRLNSSHLVI